MRYLIVNADDFNLTQGISRAVFCAHDRGIVNSTSVMINFPLSSYQISGLSKRPGLSVGLHLNVTSGSPKFKKASAYLSGKFDPHVLFAEYESQIKKFQTVFKRKPDHLDTHHHIHASPKVALVLSKISRKYKIPARRSATLRSAATTDYFFGNLSPQKYWTHTSLLTILENLPQGTSEIMCHPGFVDSDLRSKSSFLKGRECERKLFSKRSWRLFLRRHGIQQVKFSSLLPGSVL